MTMYGRFSITRQSQRLVQCMAAQRRNGLCFGSKPVEGEFIIGQVSMQQFHGNRAVEREMLAEVDFGHAAVPDQLANLDFGEDASDPVSHRASRDGCVRCSIASWRKAKQL
jgi:hypothetical protein